MCLVFFMLRWPNINVCSILYVNVALTLMCVAFFMLRWPNFNVCSILYVKVT